MIFDFKTTKTSGASISLTSKAQSWTQSNLTIRSGLFVRPVSCDQYLTGAHKSVDEFMVGSKHISWLSYFMHGSWREVAGPTGRWGPRLGSLLNSVLCGGGFQITLPWVRAKLSAALSSRTRHFTHCQTCPSFQFVHQVLLTIQDLPTTMSLACSKEHAHCFKLFLLIQMCILHLTVWFVYFLLC